MKSYELHSVSWTENNGLYVIYRTKSFFSGASGLQTGEFTLKEFVEKFGRELLPPKPQK